MTIIFFVSLQCKQGTGDLKKQERGTETIGLVRNPTSVDAQPASCGLHY